METLRSWNVADQFKNPELNQAIDMTVVTPMSKDRAAKLKADKNKKLKDGKTIKK